jgi:hypothetical protein
MGSLPTDSFFLSFFLTLAKTLGQRISRQGMHRLSSDSHSKQSKSMASWITWAVLILLSFHLTFLPFLPLAFHLPGIRYTVCTWFSSHLILWSFFSVFFLLPFLPSPGSQAISQDDVLYLFSFHFT